MRAIYLTGEHLYTRALVAADKECAAAWFDSPFPINAVRAEACLLRDEWLAARSVWRAKRAADSG